MEFKVGQKIRIDCLYDKNRKFDGKTGIIESIKKDDFGDIKLYGTWGSIALYPYADKIKIIDEGEN